MLVKGFAAPMFATNCWIIAPAAGSECIVFDPGMPDLLHTPDLFHTVAAILDQFKLKPIAVIATHGHLDHTFSITPIANGYGIPAYIHSEDRALLLHPERALSPEFATTLGPMDFVEPSDVRELRNGDLISLLDFQFRAIHAPGHTRGSLMFEINGEILVSGDVLFAGGIGRTDLPTGSAKDMEQTLRKKVLPLADHLRVLTGHGPETTIGRERKHNPYLQNLRGSY